MPLADCLARIDARDAEVRGWVSIDRTAAGGAGPLAGLVLGVKDVIDVAGFATTYGSPIYAGNMANVDAECVARLRAAGAIVLGKTVTAEFATYHPGPTVNPRKSGHTPGGSSSGSAAVVADGQADIALGTQTAGSMIRPASYCGVLGFKPTFGRYPLAGILETSPSLDTLGLFARRLDQLVLADAVLSGDGAQPPAADRLTVGLCQSPAWAEASDAMQAAFVEFGAALAKAGHRIVERELPEPFNLLGEAQAIIHRREAWLTLGHIRRDHPDAVSPEFCAMIDQGGSEDEATYRAALAMQRQCTAMMPDVFAGIDMLLVPGATGAAPAGVGATGNPAFQRIWTAVGAPCLGFPAAWQPDGLPLGLQIIGAPSSDRQLLANAGIIAAHAALRGN